MTYDDTFPRVSLYVGMPCLNYSKIQHSIPTQGLQGHEEHLRDPGVHRSDTARRGRDCYKECLSEQGELQESPPKMSTLMVSVLFAVQCCALSPETVKELDRRLEHFIEDFTSSITNSDREAGLPENVYAPKDRTQRKVGFQMRLYPFQ